MNILECSIKWLLGKEWLLTENPFLYSVLFTIEGAVKREAPEQAASI